VPETAEKQMVAPQKPSEVDNNQELADLKDSFYSSDTFKCIMKERETLNVFKQVRKDIEVELGQREAKCRLLIEKVDHLIDMEKRLMMAIEGVQVQNEMDLESLQ
jgi:hypothetical protein